MLFIEDLYPTFIVRLFAYGINDLNENPMKIYICHSMLDHLKMVTVIFTWLNLEYISNINCGLFECIKSYL